MALAGPQLQRGEGGVKTVRRISQQSAQQSRMQKKYVRLSPISSDEHDNPLES